VAALALGAAIAGAVLAGALALILGASTTAGPENGTLAPATTIEAVAALTATAPPLPVAPAAEIVVDVAGGVLNPGLRSLREGDRVGDAIAAAGGFAPRADLAETSRVVNLAMPLTDGIKILVPELGTGPAPGGGSGSSEGDGLIDLNGADQAELESLPGIGPVTATEIIDAREAQPFDSVEDLRDRGVVGPSVFEQIRDLVRAGGA
jgi:competence protein ComEA